MIHIEFSLDHPLLRESLRDLPETRLTWERTDRAKGGRVWALLWAEGEDLGAFERATGDDPTVASISRVVESHERRLYKVEIDGDALDETYPLLVDLGCLVRELSVTQEGWEARIVFPEQSAVDRFFDHCRTDGLSFRIHRVYEERDEADRETFGLTDRQLETLRTAVEFGYLDVPRRSTLEDLGDRLGISDTAVSQRFRRGVKRLVENTLSTDAETRPEPVERLQR
jgi:hypothetical protein